MNGTAPLLNSFDGGPAPAGLAQDLRQLATLDEAALEAFWGLLELNLAHSVDDRVGLAARQFCADHDVQESALVAMVRGARLLIRTAALADTPAYATVDESDEK